MKIKAKREWDTLSVPIGGGPQSVTVRESAIADIQRIEREATVDKMNPVTGAVEKVVDEVLKKRRTIAHYIADMTGWTPDRVLDLAPLETGSGEELDLPDPGPDGTIVYDPQYVVWYDSDRRPHNLAEYLWVRANPLIFSAVIRRVSFNLAESRRAIEEAKKNSFASSSVSGVTAVSPAPASNAGNGSKPVTPDGMEADASQSASGLDSTDSAGTC